jgi:hypothetical protein
VFWPLTIVSGPGRIVRARMNFYPGWNRRRILDRQGKWSIKANGVGRRPDAACIQAGSHGCEFGVQQSSRRSGCRRPASNQYELRSSPDSRGTRKAAGCPESTKARQPGHVKVPDAQMKPGRQGSPVTRRRQGSRKPGTIAKPGSPDRRVARKGSHQVAESARMAIFARMPG